VREFAPRSLVRPDRGSEAPSPASPGAWFKFFKPFVVLQSGELFEPLFLRFYFDCIDKVSWKIADDDVNRARRLAKDNRIGWPSFLLRFVAEPQSDRCRSGSLPLHQSTILDQFLDQPVSVVRFSIFVGGGESRWICRLTGIEVPT
jgi:hypothetical protein